MAIKTEFELTGSLLDKINSFSRKKLKPEEVYTFPVLLCDNEVDRDFERFSINALKKLAELFVGKTGIFDHDPKGANQNARIFDTEIMTDESVRTRAGETYTALVGKAYMVRTAGNADLIAEIDGGIKKEVSVSCSVGSKKCSICGADASKRSCRHVKGKSYGGKVCHTVLGEPTDAFEWSFVAVPAQRNAGVAKTFSEVPQGECGAENAVIDRTVLRELKAQIIRRSWLLQPQTGLKEYSAYLDTLNAEELFKIKSSLEEKAFASDEPVLTCLTGGERDNDNNIYKL